MKKNLYHIDNAEISRILEMHKTATKKQYLKESVNLDNSKNNDNVIITDWLSPDERYVIFLDELFDLNEKKSYGNIWEDVSNLVVFLEHTYRTSNLSETIKEHAANTFSKFLLTEGKLDLTQHKNVIKEMLINESMLGDVWQGAKDWGSEFVQSTKKGITDFGKDVWKGAKKLGGAVLSGDVQEIINLLKKGTLYVARKIRQAVYSEAGLIIDTLLIVSGVGKVAQFIVWAIVVALDIYEYSTGNYEHPDEPDWMRVLFFSIDVLGMVTAGSAAIAARRVVKAATVGVKTSEEIGSKIAKSPKLKDIIETISNNLSGGGNKMEQAGRKLGSGKIGTWFKGVLSKMGGFFKYLGETLAKLLSFKTLKAGAKTAVVVGGLGTLAHTFKNYQEKNNSDISKNDINALTDGSADYSGLY
jgi:hypothetical protein